MLELLKDNKIEPGAYVSAVGGMEAALDLMHEVRNRRLEGKGVIYPHKSGSLCPVDRWSAEQEERYLAGAAGHEPRC